MIPFQSLFRTQLHLQGFHAVCHDVQEPWFDSSKDFMNVKLIVSSCSISQADVVIELLIFYDRRSYLWHGPLSGDTAAMFTEYSEAYNR